MAQTLPRHDRVREGELVKTFLTPPFFRLRSWGRAWAIGEDRLKGPAGEEFPREPACRTFWFAWFAQFPTTLLVR
jgi:hypothetical protein